MHDAVPKSHCQVSLATVDIWGYEDLPPAKVHIGGWGLGFGVGAASQNIDTKYYSPFYGDPPIKAPLFLGNQLRLMRGCEKFTHQALPQPSILNPSSILGFRVLGL